MAIPRDHPAQERLHAVGVAAHEVLALLGRRAGGIAEVARGVALVDALEEQDGVGPSRAVELYCLMVLNLNEFIYLD